MSHVGYRWRNPNKTSSSNPALPRLPGGRRLAARRRRRTMQTRYTRRSASPRGSRQSRYVFDVPSDRLLKFRPIDCTLPPTSPGNGIRAVAAIRAARAVLASRRCRPHSADHFPGGVGAPCDNASTAAPRSCRCRLYWFQRPCSATMPKRRYFVFAREARAHHPANLRRQNQGIGRRSGVRPDSASRLSLPCRVRRVSQPAKVRCLSDLLRQLVVNHVLFHERQALHNPAVAVARLAGVPPQRHVCRGRIRRALSFRR